MMRITTILCAVLAALLIGLACPAWATSTYTDGFGLEMPAQGDVGWDDAVRTNHRVFEVLTQPALLGNYVVSGCTVADDGGIVISWSAGMVRVNGLAYQLESGVTDLTGSLGMVWVCVVPYGTGVTVDVRNTEYYMPSGTSGFYVPLALAATDPADIARLRDVRNVGPSYVVDARPGVNMLPNSRLGAWSYSDGPHKMSGVSVTAISGTSMTIATAVTPLNVGDLVTFCGSGSNEPDTGVSVYEITVRTDDKNFTLDRGATSGVTDAYLTAPGRVAADSYAGLDLWARTSTLKVYQERYSTGCTPGAGPGGASYAVKMMKGADGSENLYFPILTVPSRVAQFAGNWVTFSVDVKAVNASNVRLVIGGTGVGTTYSSYHTGGGEIERLSMTRYIPPGAASLTFYIQCDGDTGQIAWAMRPRVNLGTVDGGYAPIQGEVIPLAQYVTPTDLLAATVSANMAMRMQAQTLGKLSGGARALYGTFQGTNAAAGTLITFGNYGSNYVDMKMVCQVGAVQNVISGWAFCDTSVYTSELIYVYRTTTWTAASWFITAVMY